LKLVHFETLYQFSHSSFEIREFNHFNQIVLGLFDVSYTFQNCIWIIYTRFIWCFVHISELYLNYLYCLTHFYFNVKSNTIMKCQTNLTKFD